MSQIPIGWLINLGVWNLLLLQQVIDDADGIPVTDPSMFTKRLCY